MASDTEQNMDNSEEFNRSEYEKYCQRITQGSEKLWKCTICCLSNFKFKCLAENHVMSVHLHKNGCTWCKKTFKTLDEVKLHCQKGQCKAGKIKRINKNRKMLVDKSLEMNRQNNDQALISDSVESSDTNSCSGMDKCFNDSSESKREEKGVSNPEQNTDQPHPNLKESDEFPCHRCGQKFISKQKVYWHQIRWGCGFQQQRKMKDPQDITKCYSLVADKSEKAKWNMYRCLVCKSCHPNQYAVKRHIRRLHWKQKNYSCPICKKEFFEVTSWKYHTNIPLGCRNVTVAVEEALKTDQILEDYEKQDQNGIVKDMIREGSASNKVLDTWKYHTNIPLGCRNVTVAVEEALKTDQILEDYEKQDQNGIVKDMIREGSASNKVLDITVTNEILGKDIKCEIVDIAQVTKHSGLSTLDEDYNVSKYAENTNSVSHAMDSTQDVVYSRPNEDSLNEEIENVEGDDSKMYLCRMCEECVIGTKKYKEHLVQELRKSSQYLPTSCSSCKKQFTTKRALLYHAKLSQCSKRLKRLQCDSCKESFRSKVLLRQHKKSCPGSVDPTINPATQQQTEQKGDKATKKVHSCLICEIDFDKYRDKADHMKSAHPDGAAVMCIRCNKQYKSLKDLRCHKRIYHPAQTINYQCQMCSYETTNKYALKQHSKKHSEEKVTVGHICEHCNLEYSSAQALKRHLQQHQIIKNHVCHICGKGFTQKCTLDRHLDSHGNIKRYKCAKCNQKYTQSYPLTKHVKTFHPEIFGQFQKERQTAKWKNVQPEDTATVKPSRKAVATSSKRNFITIVQVPKEDTDESGQPKYRYIFMNSTGKIVRPNESDLMGSLMTACDITEESEANKPRVIKAKAKVIKPVSRPRQKQVSIVIPPAPKPKPPNNENTSEPVPAMNENPEVLTFQMLSELNFDLAQSECMDMTLGFDTESNKLTLFHDQAADSVLTTDTPMLNPDILDFGTLGIGDLGEDQTFGFLQNVPEDYWYDFSQSDTNLLSGILATDNPLQNPADETQTAVCNQETVPQNTMLTQELVQNTVLTEEIVPQPQASTSANLESATNVELPTVRDIPSWTGDQMVLVQDGENSYLISADDLAKLGNTPSENTGEEVVSMQSSVMNVVTQPVGVQALNVAQQLIDVPNNTLNLVEQVVGIQYNSVNDVKQIAGVQSNTVNVVDPAVGIQYNSLNGATQIVGVQSNTVNVVEPSVGTQNNAMDVVEQAVTFITSENSITETNPVGNWTIGQETLVPHVDVQIQNSSVDETKMVPMDIESETLRNLLLKK